MKYNGEKKCKCGNKPNTDAENCKKCCDGFECCYGCGTCFCQCHDNKERNKNEKRKGI